MNGPLVLIIWNGFDLFFVLPFSIPSSRQLIFCEEWPEIKFQTIISPSNEAEASKLFGKMAAAKMSSLWPFLRSSCQYGLDFCSIMCFLSCSGKRLIRRSQPSDKKYLACPITSWKTTVTSVWDKRRVSDITYHISWTKFKPIPGFTAKFKWFKHIE